MIMQKTMIGTYSYPIAKLPIIEEFQNLAQREGVKVSPLLVKLIEEYVKSHKEGNPQHLITSSIENEDFMGFPSMAISDKNKRIYLQKMPEDMREAMMFHLQSWSAFLKEL